jgi:hypothetical protein
VYYIAGMRAYNMSKIIVAKGLQADNNMANMSAEILRNFIAKSFGIDAKQIVLSGELPEKLWISDANIYFHYLEGESFQKEVDVFSRGCKSNQSNWELFPTIRKTTTAILIETSGYGGCCRRWTLFKTPNFGDLEKIDIARWEQWLSE